MSNIADIIKSLVLEFGMHPYDINCGECENFAYQIADVVDGAEPIWGAEQPQLFTQEYDPGSHCYIRYNGFFYDSEEPHGVDTPMKLPLFHRQADRAKKQRKVETVC